MSVPYRRSFDTVATLISDAAIELGLEEAPITDPYAETSVHIIQLLAILKSLGQDLQRTYDWSQLHTEGSFTTDATNIFSLPDDFDRFIEDTTWNRTDTTQTSSIGAREWQEFKARSTVGTANLQLRLQGSSVKILPVTDTGSTVYYEYVTAYWVQSAAAIVALTGPDKDAPTVSTDRVWFDRRAIITGLKMRWLQDRGYPAEAAERQHSDALSSAKSSGPGKPVSLTSGRSAAPQMGTPPETDWGT
jgi:hypothetical protein